MHLRWWADWDKTDLNELILGEKGYKTMKKLSDRQKTLIKWLCVLVLVGLIIYVFRDMAGPIMSQLVKTSPVVVAAILGATLLYGVIESCITFILMRQVENNMTFFDANIMTYFCVILQGVNAWERYHSGIHIVHETLQNTAVESAWSVLY